MDSCGRQLENTVHTVIVPGGYTSILQLQFCGENFHGLLPSAMQTHAISPQNFAEKLSRIATKLWNSQKFSPSKVSRHMVLQYGQAPGMFLEFRDSTRYWESQVLLAVVINLTFTLGCVVLRTCLFIDHCLVNFFSPCSIFAFDLNLETISTAKFSGSTVYI